MNTEHFLPYLVDTTDLRTQSEFIAQFGNEKVKNGICFNLCLAVLYEYLKNNRGIEPSQIWNTLKSGPEMTQIANNQRGYIEHGFTENDMYDMYKLEEQERIAFKTKQELAAAYRNLQCNNQGLIIISLYNKDSVKIGRHAIAHITHHANFYIYDPNIGLMKIPMISCDELMNRVFEYYNDLQLDVEGYINSIDIK